MEKTDKAGTTVMNPVVPALYMFVRCPSFMMMEGMGNPLLPAENILYSVDVEVE